jgi:hypothetical protein
VYSHHHSDGFEDDIG